jgi:dolichol-phosphate mannosyltransferase
VRSYFGAGAMLLQLGASLAVYGRLARHARSPRLRYAPAPDDEACLPPVAVVIPVLNEAKRLGPCLAALRECRRPVARIVVVDTGSHDGTPDLVRAAMSADARIRLVEAGAPPPWWANGKAWGLRCALDSVETAWVLMTDADVVLGPRAPARLLATALASNCGVLSAAPRMTVRGPLAALHAAMLASLLFRVGLPGTVARREGEVLANGQAMLARSELLCSEELWRLAARSRCEDVTIARTLHAAGVRVGSVEATDIEVAMYDSVADAWRNWPRSLALRDGLTRPAPWNGLGAATAVQALPLTLLVAIARRRDGNAARAAALFLIALRFAVGLGVARTYPNGRGWAALAPLADLPVALRLWHAALARRHRWRGRLLAEVV